MFHLKSPTASPTKHVIYLIAATVLGLLLSFLVHAIIEILYLQSMEKQGIIVILRGVCALPWALQYLLWAIGGVGGFILGRFWWRKIYIEKVWCRR